MIDHEVGPDAENGGLHDDAEDAGEAAQPCHHVVGGLLRLQIGVVGLHPLLGHAGAHAERLQQRGIATGGLGQLPARRRERDGGQAWAAREPFRQQRERADDQRAEQDGESDQRVKQEADRDVERHPRQVEEGRQPDARNEGPHAVEVPNGLQTLAGGPRLERRAHHDFERARRQFFVEPAPDAQQDAPAQHVEQPLEGEQHEDEQGKSDQGRNAAARQHAVVDLEHEERAGEAQTD